MKALKLFTFVIIPPLSAFLVIFSALFRKLYFMIPETNKSGTPLAPNRKFELITSWSRYNLISFGGTYADCSMEFAFVAFESDKRVYISAGLYFGLKSNFLS